MACTGAASTKWKLVPKNAVASEIASTAAGLCVTAPAAGTRLVVAACTDSPAGTWHLT